MGSAGYHSDERARPAGHEKPAPLDLSHHFSAVTKRRVASQIKQAYKFFQIPGILNIAGGLPHVDFFPFDTLEAQAAKPERWTPSPNHPAESAVPSASSDPAAATHITVPKTLDESDPLKKVDLATALQYGLAEGYPPLLSWVRQFTRDHLHPDTPYRDGPEVVLTCGSTDGFAKTLSLFVDEWTEGVNDIRQRPGLLCETFVYTNVLGQAVPLGMHIAPVKADAFGMAVEGPGGLEDVLANWDPAKGKRPHLMYTVTLGHNPTGIVLSVERKKEIYAVCSRYDVIIVEDEPYWYLQFPSAATEEAKSRGKPAPPVPQQDPHTPTHSSGSPFLDSLTPSFLALDTDGRVVRLDTFSKTVAPGCRLGWITAQPAIAERFQRISEATTQQPSGFVQGLIAELVLGPHAQQSAQQRAARSTFARLLTPAQQAAFSGWDVTGWIRWLAGLRGTYERRMARMCRVLDAHAVLITTTTTPSQENWTAIATTPLYTFAWPRGGMFVWLSLNLAAHALFGAPGLRLPALTGPVLSTALMVFLTRKPFRVLVATGSMFSADDAVRRDEGWRYYRLCFAAEAEEHVAAAAERFAQGVHAFWAVRDAGVVEELLEEVAGLGGVEGLGAGVGVGEDVVRLGGVMGC
ncbi:PLP-dependent transferase [Trichocladium antarcticum]|uniref:PLP-dependent transferase n=1 Tax=Trichocladium antarcticum TaxID=1450529 RepID=A0AAN6UTL8_9PEZI|nr:PLP-dependent transferase [Trichocladium antarcticum]